ncbi:hypothetical protein [Elizabethkingia anophelis]
MKYPPEKPNQSDANFVGNGSFMPAVEKRNPNMKSIYYLFFICISIYCNAQNLKCDTINEKHIQYVEFEIISKDLYPVKMYAVFDDYNPNKFDYKDSDSFIRSFYKSGIYTPYLEKGYKQMVFYCKDSIQANILIKRNEKIILKTLQLLEKQLPEKIKLATGDIVHLKKVAMGGLFTRVNKNSKAIFANSLEWDILDIDEIKYSLIPFDNLAVK